MRSDVEHWLNQRNRTDNGLSRRELFERQEKAALQPLPGYPFDYLEVKQAKVHIDYHITSEKHHYSVPHRCTRQTVLIRASERLVEIYHQNQRVACHVRCDRPGYTTEVEHMPAVTFSPNNINGEQEIKNTNKTISTVAGYYEWQENIEPGSVLILPDIFEDCE